MVKLNKKVVARLKAYVKSVKIAESKPMLQAVRLFDHKAFITDGWGLTTFDCFDESLSEPLYLTTEALLAVPPGVDIRVHEDKVVTDTGIEIPSNFQHNFPNVDQVLNQERETAFSIGLNTKLLDTFSKLTGSSEVQLTFTADNHPIQVKQNGKLLGVLMPIGSK